MEKHEGDARCYSHESQTAHWKSTKKVLGDDVEDEFIIGFYAPDGGTSGEFFISWEKVGKSVCPRLKAFGDSWSSMFHMQDLLEKMAEIGDIPVTPNEFRQILDSLGFKDITVRK